MGINQEEIKSVSSLEPFKRYQYFLKRIADNEKIYTLENGEGEWASSTIKIYELYPIWSSSEFASKCLIDEWAEFKVIEFVLDEFIKIILPKIEKGGLLLNIFPVGKTTGFVVKIDEFIRDINEELQNYE